MQIKMKRGTRYVLQVALLASLTSAACLPAAIATPSGASNPTPNADVMEAQAQSSWRESMTHIAAPTKGCFHATYPSIAWQQVGCNTAPPREHPVLRRDTKGKPQTTGNGNDYALESSTPISSTTGTFPSVTGVTSEQGVGVSSFGGGGILGPNEYTLQINSNADTSTAACNSHSGCVVWQQFIYSPDYSTQGEAAVFMQYWLIGYGGSTCPNGFGSDGSGDCYENSAAVPAPDVPITSLANLKMSGNVVAGGNDTAVFTNGTEAYSVSGDDSVLDLASAWSASEFNIVGNAGGSEADFNSGSTVQLNVTVNNGSTSAPTCASNSGTTGETNNLTLGSCTTSGGSSPSISFTESN